MRGFRNGKYRMRRLVKSLYQLGVIGVAALGCGGLFLMNPALANPVVNNVAGGSATVQQNGNTETINQSSQKAIINWNTFNIGKGETTRFIQPTGGIALNRINPAQGVSKIYGTLTATGQIILINGAGIYFGPSAYVNVGGLIASTEDISNQNFLNGNYSFTSIPGYSGSIINEGSIIAAENGLIALVGRGVENTGLIQADLGNVVLASGDAFTISFDGNDLINFVINTPTSQRGLDENGNPLPNGVTNIGTIAANGGTVLITAQAAAGVLNDVINMQGIVQAQSVSSYNGEIILSGDPNSGEVYVGGTLDASGAGAGQTGGTVQITGYNILLDSPAVINVSGDAGGGTVSIGGSLHGEGPLPDSNAVVMEPGAVILANAITTGNGGNVTLWSNDYTGAYGSISATGGALGGNGGEIDTSSGNVLNVAGLLVNTSAPNGTVGNWLLDPYNVTICTGTGCTTTNPPGSTFSTFTPESTSTVAASDIENNLENSSVTITTGNGGTDAGNISINNNVEISWSNHNTLLLNAYGSILFGSGVTIYNPNNSSTLGLEISGPMDAGSEVELGSSTIQVGGMTIIAPTDTVDMSQASIGLGSSGLIANNVGQVNLPTNLSTNSGVVQLGTVQLEGDDTIDTTGSGQTSGASITIGNVNSPSYSLNLIDGSGGVTFNGSTVQLEGLEIQGAGVANLYLSGTGTVQLGAGGLGVPSAAVDLPISLITDSGTVSLNAVSLNSNATIDTTNSGASSGADVTIGSISTVSNNDLTINNGSGEVTLGTAFGLSGLTIQGSGEVYFNDSMALESGGLSIPNASQIDLPASITTQAGPVDLGSSVISQDTTIDTTDSGGSSSGADITLGTMESTGNWNLTLNQGSSGDLTLNGDINVGSGGAFTAQGSGTTTINADQLSTGTQFFIGPVVFTASSLQDNAVIATFENTISGSNTALTFGNSGGNNITFENGATLASLYVAPEITITGGSITTSGSQTYEGDVDINNASIAMTAGDGINLVGPGVSGAGNTLNLTSGGTIDITGSIYLGNLNVTGSGTAANNTLSLGTTNSSGQVWNITDQNSGNITGINNITGSFTFSNIGNLVGATTDSGTLINDFIFQNSAAALSGSITGANTTSSNTIDYSNYGSPITTTLTSVSSGSTTNGSNTLNSFSDIDALVGTGAASTLSVPTSLTVSPTSSTSGTIGDPLTYSGYTVSQPSPTPTPTPTPTPSNNTSTSTAAQQSAAVASNMQSNSTGSSNSNTDTNSSGEVLWAVTINGTSQNVNQIIQDFSTQYQQTLQKVVVSPMCFQSGQG
jgi:filamentous hemagglutinin family protein